MSSHEPTSARERQRARRLSRRGFLTGSGATALIAGVAAVAEGCASVDHHYTAAPKAPQYENTPNDTAQDEEVPGPPSPSELSGPDTTLKFFTPDEARTADALFSRIMPGDANDPGAHEAGVVYYVDYTLSQPPEKLEKLYTKPPFATPFDGDQPPTQPAGGPEFQVIWVKKSELPRYGAQSPLSSSQMYRVGIMALDMYCTQKYGKKFADLASDQQDSVVGDLANDNVSTFTAPSAFDFFDMLRQHVVEGFFSDPAYGGNKDMAGWKLVGYPGAQRGYTEQDMKAQAPPRPPQSLAMLHMYMPGMTDQNNVIYPVSGSHQQ